MRTVIFLLLNRLLLTSGSGPGNFVEDAGQWMEAGYKTWVRLGEEVEDVTVIEVRARLSEMLGDPGAIDRDRVSLEIRAGDSGWRLAQSEPVIRSVTFNES